MAQSYPGVLHNYAPGLTAFEFKTSNQTPKPNSLLFVGGLTDGFCTVPYVASLAKALESTDWSIYSVLLTSSYSGWGTGSLDQDVEEIGQCVNYVRSLKSKTTAPHGAGKIVIMGHSTGSQDMLHYLYAANPVATKPAVNGVKGLVRPVVDGAIMQAPVSDREAILGTIRESPEGRQAYETLVEFARQEIEGGRAMSICPVELTGLVGLPPHTPVSARRFWSLASPESPLQPAEDDLFSSDATDESLEGTFGMVSARGLLRGRLAVMYSGSDEYAPQGVDKEALLSKWRSAMDKGQGENKWDEASGVIPGASHNVKDEGQGWLLDHVLDYLKRV